MPNERRFYTLTEAAQVLGVHYETAARWVRSGKLPGVKLSRRKVVVPKEKCHALLSGRLTFPSATRSLIDSRQWWLPLVGTLTSKEAAKLRAIVEECFEKVEEED